MEARRVGDPEHHLLSRAFGRPPWQTTGKRRVLTSKRNPRGFNARAVYSSYSPSWLHEAGEQTRLAIDKVPSCVERNMDLDYNRGLQEFVRRVRDETDEKTSRQRAAPTKNE